MSIGSLFKGDERSVLVKKNIAGSLIIKGWSCVIQLLLVPLTLKCLSPYEYGVWLTINSILIWIDSFDIGLGNGLRNKLVEALANNDKEKARRYVSTTFIMLIIIIIPIMLLSFILVHYLDFNSILNIDSHLVKNINGIILVSCSFVCSTFIFKFIGNIYLGLQLPAINNLLVVSGQTLAFLIIFIISFFGHSSLINVAVIYTLSPLIVYIVSYPITFIKYKYLSPSCELFDKSAITDLFCLGINFFIVQISGLVIFASSNLLISNLFTPAEVTPYQISYRYYSLILLIFSIIAAPLWSATTDAYTKGDWTWIKNVMKKMHKLMLIIFLLLIIMDLISVYVYKIWVGDEITISFSFSALMSLYILILIYSTCYSNILFGIGKIRVLTVVTLFEAVIYIPIAILLGKRCGLYGIVLALILVNSICAIKNKIQYNKLSNGYAKNIWNK